jgi:light-regulated signal transduction histidine kinase (bacteriophytochrome)
VVFEDLFLIVSCIMTRAETQEVCRKRAELEASNRELAARDELLAASARQAQLLSELESANQELNDFAYVVSHDLKAPLRAIGSLASWIVADCGDRLDDDGKQHLELLLGRVKRMNNLIEGVLQYSRVGRVREKKEPTNLSSLVPEVLDLLAPPANVEVRIDSELPTVVAEKTRLSQVFHNLVSNGIKFLDKPQGQIRIGCTDDGQFWRFHVADNGPGIEERHFEKVFQIFQTLQPRDTLESTGIGLAVVKKAVEVHGGKVWLNSEVGVGSTFYFTLPKTNWNAAALLN